MSMNSNPTNLVITVVFCIYIFWTYGCRPHVGDYVNASFQRRGTMLFQLYSSLISQFFWKTLDVGDSAPSSRCCSEQPSHFLPCSSVWQTQSPALAQQPANTGPALPFSIFSGSIPLNKFSVYQLGITVEVFLVVGHSLDMTTKLSRSIYSKQ